MTAEPAVMSAPAKTASAEATPAVTTPTATAPTVTTPDAVVPDVITPTEDITTPGVTDTPGITVVPGATDTPGTTDTPGAAVIPETLTIHLNGNGGEPALSTMTESMDAVSAEGWSVPFRLGKDGACRSGLARCLTAGIWTRDALFHLQE